MPKDHEPKSLETNEFRIFTGEALHDLLHFDTKLFRSLPLLVFRPGELTRRTFSSEKDQYVKPVALFVFLNFLFFVIKSKGLFQYSLHTYQLHPPLGFMTRALHDGILESGLSMAIFQERFNTAMHFEQKEYLVILVPFLALALQLLYLKAHRHFIEYLTFSLHFFSFFIFVLILLPYVIIPVNWLTVKVFQFSLETTETPLLIILLFTCAMYFYLALARLYPRHWFGTARRAVILSFVVLALVVYVYRVVLFFAVLHSIPDLGFMNA